MADEGSGPGGGGDGPRPNPRGSAPGTPPAAGDRRPPGLLDYYLGTKEGRSRLLVVIWALSLVFMGIGYGLIVWIFIRGGL